MTTKHQKPRYAATGERIVRTVRTPRELPLAATVEDAYGARLRRFPEGWRHVTKGGTPHGDPMGTLDLAFPLQVLSTQRGYHYDRTTRRARDRAARTYEAKAHRHEHPAKTTGRHLGPAREPRPHYGKTVNGMTLRQADAHVYERALATVGRGA